ncbi:hypothetical protein LSAT2_004275 [Lamellibrachia satsuma]|nr:hypothetical protein LSAT2_004275 [Lamellibrachia satsuma]
MDYLSREFVEDHASWVVRVPEEWGVTDDGNFYQLNLKMCNIRKLVFSFKWGERVRDKTGSVTEQPDKLLALNVSLNDLKSLEEGHLAPLSELRHVDASLNQIHRMSGLETLTKLHSLDMSHNLLRRLDPAVLQRFQHLVTLKLAMNEIEEMSDMPTLSKLTVLHINDNKLKSLDGVQALPHLTELYTQRNNLVSIVSFRVVLNVADLAPLAASFRLSVLDASDNAIDSLHGVVHIIKDLKQLQTILLLGNPIEREVNYNSVLTDVSNIVSLDKINVRPHPKHTDETHKPSEKLETVKDVMKQAFHEKLREQKQKMEENVEFFHRKIAALQTQHKEYEERMLRELDQTMRHLDAIALEDAYQLELKKPNSQRKVTKPTVKETEQGRPRFEPTW